MKKSNKQIKQLIWSRKVMGSVVVAGALISAGVFGLNGYFGGGEQGIPEDTMTRGLVAAYNFDEGSGQTAYNAADTGSVNDGTLTNGPKWTEGKEGGALQFDGSNDYVNCGKDSSLNITDAITIEAWVKPAVDMEASGGWFIVYKKDERATSSGYGIWIVDGQLGVWINDTGRNYNASLSVDTWLFITGTYEDGSLKIYENGELKSTHTDVTGPISTNAIDLIIGKEGPSYANYFNGSIDDVKIYNRVLSASEVKYHYNRGGPVAHWRFDEGEGQIVYDSTGNNNDGTLGATSASASDDPSWVVGKHNSALEFDGSDDYVSVPDDDSLDITDAITIELWVNDPPPESPESPESLTQSEQQEQQQEQQQQQEQEQQELTQLTVLNALADQTKVQPGDMMTVRAEIKDDYGIESVKADISEIRSEKLKDRKHIENQRSADSIVSNQNFTKEYKSKEKSLLIQNKDKSKIIDLELVSPYNTRVSEGNSVLVADILLKDWEGRNTLFDELNFYNVKNGYQKLNKQFVYKYAEEKIIQIPIEIPEIGEKFIEELVADWDNAVEFNTLDELPHKNIRVGIFTETILNEKIEWLPFIDGFDIYEWAAYDVTELHYLEHDTDMGTHNSLVMIDSTHFILAYYHSYYNHYGYIKTFSIDGSYNITQIDSLQHDTSGTYNSLVKIDSTHFILAYSDYYSDGRITTFSIDGSYNITELHSIEHDTSKGTHNSLVMIDSTHFILAYAGYGDDGYIKVFTIDGSYNISQTSSIEHDTANGIYNSLVMIDSTHFILAYNYYYFMNNYGYIKTFSIDGSYNITQIDSLQHDGTNGAYNSFVKIDSTHFILAYSGSGGDGYIKVFTIDGSYNISQTSSIEHDTVYGTYSSLVMIDSTHFILAYCNSSGFFYYGYIKVFSIDGSYNITQESSLQHDGTNGEYNSLVKIDGTHFILAYTGSGDDGYIKTFSMESGNSAPTVTISASTSVEETTATLNGNVTATGGDNPSVTVYWGTSDGGTTPGSWASNSVPTSPSQPQGVASFYKNAASLNPGTLYYFSAKATNSAGTDWPAASLSFTTKPNPPTSLSATAQSQTQIDVSWTKGSGAEKTMVRRKIGSYPTSVSDGDQAYFDTGSNFNDTSLSCGNNYYYRAWSYKTGAPNSGYSDSYAEDNASTNACNSAPTVTISASTSVEETTATLNGNVTATGGDNPSVTVYWGTSDGGTTPGSWASNSVPTSPSQPQGVASFYKNAASLNPGTLYYFSAKATNSAGTDWPAASLSFTTKPNPPTSLSATAQSQTQIDVSWTKGSGAEKTMVRRKIGSYPTSVSDGDQAYFDTGSNFNDTSLSCGNNYYYRAWSYKTGAPNSGYSDSYAEDNASTNACNSAPTVTISASTSVEETTATLNGNVTATGGDNPSVTVYWGTSDGGTTPGSWASNSVPTSPSQPQGVASFYKNAASLNPGTLYYFSAKATNSAGTDWPAASLSFTTKPNPPTSLSATAQSQTQIDVSWTKGSGAEKTMVRRKIGSYPTSVSDGDQAYFDTGSNFNDTSLSCGNNYYYRAWSYKTGAPNSGYSDSYAEDNASTNACNSAPDIPTLSSPSDGATGQSITPDLVFNYSDTESDNCTMFDLKVDDNSDFNSCEINETNYSSGGPWASGGTITYSVSSGLSAGTKYYWKVRVKDNANWSNWSDGSWDFTTGTGKRIISKGDSPYKIEIDDSLNVTGYIDNQTVTTQITKAWHHVVLTYDKDAGGTDEIKLYVDGVLKDTADYSTAMTTNSDVLKIGEKIPGKIDDVRIYDYARTPDEIRLDYNAGFATMFGSSGKTCEEDPASCMDNGLVASYDMDEGDGQTLYNAADTGSANDGTLGSSAGADTADPKWASEGRDPTSSSGRSRASSAAGGYLDFDGSNDYVNCGSDQSLDLKTFTIEFWIKVNSASENILFQKGTYNLNGWYISETGTNKLCWNLYNGSSGLSSCSEVNVYDMGVWTHVVMVIEGNASRTWYKNGSLNYAETSTKAWVIDDVHDFIIGKYIESGGYEFNGSIDDVKIYNRVLSASEVRYHYNRGGPVAHWRFDEGEGQVVYDSTDNNNDGTLGATSASASDDPSWVAGKHNSALEFDGVDDYVSIPDDDSLDITDAITIEAWMKPIVDGLTKKSITITGSGSQETNYQVKVDVTYDSGMQADFDDIRFVDSDGTTEIDHWRESYTLSTSAVFWVEVPIIPTGGTTIYMYYGNSSASSASNGTNTFEFFDDFEGASLDTNKWDEEATPSVSVSSSILTLETNAVNEDIKSKTYTANGYSSSVAVRTKLKLSGSIPVDFGFGQSTIYEDFTTFTEVDVAGDRIQKTANHIDHYSRRDESTYLYKDYTAGHFSDFTHKIKMKWISSGGAWNAGHAWVVANDINNCGWLQANNKTFISILLLTNGSSLPMIGLREMYLGGWNDDWYMCSYNTWYYIKLVKSGTDMKAYIYSDSGYSVLVDTLTITLDANHTLRYLYGCSTDYDGNDRNIVIDVENFDLGVLSSTHCALSKYHSADNYCLATEDGSNREISAGITMETVDYHIREIVWTSAHVKLFKDGVEQKSLTNYHPNASLPIKLGNPEDTAVGTRTGYYDWVLVRKYASPEPTATVGAGATTGISKAGAYAIGANTTTAFVSINDQTISGTISSGWNHIVLTYDKDAGGTQEMKLFANGINLSTNDYSTAITSNSSNLFIGDLAGFNGSIDDVRIYDYARTPDEIRLDYNAGFAARFGPADMTCSEDPASCMDNGLVVFYDFDEGSGQTAYNAADTGTANNGTLGSSAGVDTADPKYLSVINDDLSTTGPSCSVLDFDGTNDYLKTVSSPTLNLADEITLEVWAYLGSGTGGIQMIISREYGDSYYDEFALYLGSDDCAKFIIRDSADQYGISDDVALSTGSWHHLVGTYNGSVSKLYVDGVEEGSNSGPSGNIDAGTHPVVIGAASNDNDVSYNERWNGSIDDVRIYNRALSAEEVRYHYNRGGPVAHWRMDEGEGSTAFDESSNNNDGTLGAGTAAYEPTWVEGKYGSALNFDGTNDYVSCGNDASLNITDAITLEAWVKPDSQSGWDVIMSKDNGMSASRYGMGTKNGEIVFTTKPVTSGTWYTGISLPSGFHHLAAIYNGSQKRIYLDGELMNSTSATGNLGTINNPLKIGEGYLAESECGEFNGIIDDVRIYNYARTPAQIQMDYNAGFGAHLK